MTQYHSAPHKRLPRFFVKRSCASDNFLKFVSFLSYLCHFDAFGDRRWNFGGSLMHEASQFASSVNISCYKWISYSSVSHACHFSSLVPCGRLGVLLVLHLCYVSVSQCFSRQKSCQYHCPVCHMQACLRVECSENMREL